VFKFSLSSVFLKILCLSIFIDEGLASLFIYNFLSSFSEFRIPVVIHGVRLILFFLFVSGTCSLNFWSSVLKNMELDNIASSSDRMWFQFWLCREFLSLSMFVWFVFLVGSLLGGGLFVFGDILTTIKWSDILLGIM